MTKPKLCGWAVTSRDNTLHYFIDYRALCGGHTFYAWPSPGRIYGHCEECARLLDLKDKEALAHESLPVPAIAPQGLRLPELLCPQSAGQDVRLSPSPARRQLRLLCLLVKPKLATAEARRLPVHTMHRLPPRSMAHGRWAELCDSCLVLRETQAVAPSAEVLARCERHRQTHALRAPARTVRIGGVIA